MFSMSSRKKFGGSLLPRLILDGSVRGGISWQVGLEDCSAGGVIIPVFVTISTDTLVITEEITNDILFATPCSSIIGWIPNGTR